MTDQTVSAARGRAAVHTNAGLLVALGVLLWSPGPAWGLINPKFTPKHLVQQCEAFLVLKVKAMDAQGVVQTEALQAVKGAMPKRAPVLDLTTSAFEDQAQLLRSLLKQMGGRPVVLVSA